MIMRLLVTGTPRPSSPPCATTGSDAPWVIDGAMNGEMFDLYVETQLVPTLAPGDVIILDNLSSHKSPKAAEVMK